LFYLETLSKAKTKTNFGNNKNSVSSIRKYIHEIPEKKEKDRTFKCLLK
jgi:hypothetical protein